MSTPISLVTSARILALCPNARADIVEAIVTSAPTAFAAAGIDTSARIAHFMAQIATEAAHLTRLDENLNYTKASRLVLIWPSKFKTEADALPYVKNPQKLANHVYGTKNGNKGGTDGWDYRGSGLIQLTGRANFRDAGGQALEDDPDLARQPDSALEIAIGYWSARKINEVANGTTDDDVRAVTKPINPALLGLKERQDYFKKALKLFTPTPGMLAFAALPGMAAGGMPAMAAGGGTPSGPAWVGQFPTSRSVDDLAEPFRSGMARFLEALAAAGANVSISATWRPRERAYLMHWAWKISKEGHDPALIPAMPGVAINWVHSTLARSRAAARDMVAAYGMVHRAALNSRHTERAAVDMTIGWSGTLEIARSNGMVVAIAGQPRNGSHPDLVKVGASYGAIKLIGDPPHWSDDGR